MLTVTFAFVVVITLLLFMKTTRWMGALGVFILLCVAPVLSTLLLLLVGVVSYFLFGRPRWETIVRKLPWRN